jgi:hypothetical protein
MRWDSVKTNWLPSDDPVPGKIVAQAVRAAREIIEEQGSCPRLADGDRRCAYGAVIDAAKGDWKIINRVINLLDRTAHDLFLSEDKYLMPTTGGVVWVNDHMSREDLLRVFEVAACDAERE